ALAHRAGGFRAAAGVAWDWAGQAVRLRRVPGAAGDYRPGGRAPAAGDVVRLPALAATLDKIAAQGARAFYQGPIAEDIIATLKPRGSFLTLDDLSRHSGDETVPISTNYRGLDILELPPSGQGL